MMRGREDNPYATGLLFDYGDTTLTLERVKVSYVKSPNDQLHMVEDGDELWSLAGRFYQGNSKWWWLIADINDIFDPLPQRALVVGTLLIIPDLMQYRAFIANG